MYDGQSHYNNLMMIQLWTLILTYVKVKCSHYRSGVAQRVGRGIALLFHDRSTRRGVSGQQHAPAALYPQERPGTHFAGGWVGPRDGLDRWKILSPPGFDPGLSSPHSVAIPTELPGRLLTYVAVPNSGKLANTISLY